MEAWTERHQKSLERVRLRYLADMEIPASDVAFLKAPVRSLLGNYYDPKRAPKVSGGYDYKD